MTDAKTDTTDHHEQSGPRPISRPLRWGRRHAIIAGCAAAAVLAAVGIVWLDAPVRHSDLVIDAPGALPVKAEPGRTDIPGSFTEVFSAPSRDHQWFVPVVEDTTGAVITGNDHTVTALSPKDGTPLWHYTRDKDLCLYGKASWDSVVAVYKSGMGCGDVTAIKASTGTYAATRSAIASDDVAPIMSNSAVGIVSPERVELWRSDMVRTIEYGDVPSKQEPGMQPNEDCTIDSALTRQDLLAVVEHCAPNHVESSEAHGKNSPEVGKEQVWLRMLKRAPKDSRKPEFTASVALPGPARLVAVGEKAAAVYINDGGPKVVSYSDEGNQLAVSSVPAFPEHPVGEGSVYTPMVSDLPHHMSVFTGSTLMLLRPDTLAVEFVFPNVTGTPVSIDDHLLVPTATGYDVTSKDKKTIEKSIPVDRNGYTGPVGLKLSGSTIIEQRGDTVVGLR